MVNEDVNIGNIVLKKVRSDGLVISRVPKPTRDAFLKLAEEEFADDWGMTLKYIFDNFLMWKIFFENMDLKLDKVISMLQTTKEEDKEIKLISGKRIKVK